MTTFEAALLASVHLDASQLGLDVVIYQGKNKEKYVVIYASRCLPQNEKFYTVTEF